MIKKFKIKFSQLFVMFEKKKGTKYEKKNQNKSIIQIKNKKIKIKIKDKDINFLFFFFKKKTII